MYLIIGLFPSATETVFCFNGQRDCHNDEHSHDNDDNDDATRHSKTADNDVTNTTITTHGAAGVIS